MSEQAYRCEHILENALPYQTIEDVTYKMAQSVADAFLGQIEYGKDYVIETKVENEGWNGFATKYTYSMIFDELVRCRDCRFFSHGDDGRWCMRSIGLKSDADGFCSWGEPRVLGKAGQGTSGKPKAVNHNTCAERGE